MPVTYEKGKLYDLNLFDVQPDPEQPRKYFGKMVNQHQQKGTGSGLEK